MSCDANGRYCVATQKDVKEVHQPLLTDGTLDHRDESKVHHIEAACCHTDRRTLIGIHVLIPQTIGLEVSLSPKSISLLARYCDRRKAGMDKGRAIKGAMTAGLLTCRVPHLTNSD